MKHLDLFSGIGGFALAVDRVWPNAEHIFCDNDKFCQQVIKKHWPDSYVYEDIRAITADTKYNGELGTQEAGEHSGAQPEGKAGEELPEPEPAGVGKLRTAETGWDTVDILTGGFPCQPFSAAGRRRGTDDDRYLWPEMLRVIRLTKPTWIIAENVRGLLTIEQGVVFEQVCLDLEASGYEVQPFIIPAVSLNAPHRRDRVWFIAHRRQQHGEQGNEQGMETDTAEWSARPTNIKRPSKNDTDPTVSRRERGSDKNKGRPRQLGRHGGDQGGNWEQNWIEVAQRLCGLHDGLPSRLGGLRRENYQLYPWWRKQALKAYGNSIVPQVAEEIMKAIKEANQ